MTQMKKYPSIDQFRQVIRNVKSRAQYVGKDENGAAIYDSSKSIPTLTFEGTVKIHGTNASIVHHIDGCGYVYQSRERILTLEQDNAGFMLYMKNQESVLHDLFETLYDTLGYDKRPIDDWPSIAVYGEWCGQGIQKGVAVSELSKRFIVFGIKIWNPKDSTETRWLTREEIEDFKNENARIFNIYQFPTYKIDIDFNYPEIAQQKMVEITENVEKECPVGAYFGVSNGCGEGVVWKCITPGWTSSDFWLKVKGEKHSVSKVKTLAPVDVEAVAAVKEFVEYAVTEQRLEQMLQVLQNELLKPFEPSSLGDFIRLVMKDVHKEEQDTIVQNQIDPKKLGGPVADKCRKFFFEKYNGNA
ncbi:RNA ligase [Caulobacter phage Cr30]|uniref:RNA ligase n=1 Tax=Caulobacter phage Cr30 TaxID=1357714 RepID=UPI0004A9B7E5|nr:RNA ligase [Caulobacter phage Cr30]AGS80916.1 RNA ligase [Caulobacter phage Cr30]